MNTKKGNAIVWVLVIIIVLGLGWWFFAGRNAEDDIATTTPDTTTGEDASLEGDMIEEIIVTYGPNGFSPATVTINQGQTVRWINQSGGNMWVASAMHPTHAVYNGTTLSEHCIAGAVSIFDQCADGNVFEFTFDKVGQWSYHNHSRATHAGTVIVR